MPILHGGTKLLDPKPILERLGLSHGQHVGDLGAGGMWYFAFPAAAMVGATGKVFAVDVQKSVLTALQNMVRLQGVNNIECVWSNLERRGAALFRDATLDAVSGWGVPPCFSRFDHTHSILFPPCKRTMF